MPPLVVAAVAGSLASGVAQWMNSQAGLAATAQQRQAMQAIADQVHTPNWQPTDLTPEQYSVIGQYVPQTARYIQEVAPTLVQGKGVGAVQGQNAELTALQDLLQRSRTGNDPVAQIQRQQAAEKSAASAGSARAASLDAMQRRGLGANSGLGLASQLSGIQSSEDAQAHAGEQSAIDDANQRMQAITGAANLGGQMRTQDLSQEQTNAGITNDFNQRLASNLQNWATNAAATSNQAQQYNLGQAQTTANQNVAQGNQFQIYNQGMQKDAAQTQYENQLKQAQLKMGIPAARIGDVNASTTQQNQAIQSVGDVGLKAAGYSSAYKDPNDPNNQKTNGLTKN